ncbi:hypothetical protein ACJ41O_001530 [Fusarium nematophilum]
MLFSTISAQCFLLLGIQFVIGHTAPADEPEIHVETGVSLSVLHAKPEVFVSDGHGSVVLDDGLDKRSIRQLFPRALTTDQKTSFNLHNDAREKKNVKALVWDRNLESQARTWAKRLAKYGQFKHSDPKTRPNQGENLAFVSSSETIKDPITIGTKGWLAEIKYYRNEVIPKGKFSDYGHYTQCVWKGTTKVGIATASDGEGGWITVARYSPPGNVAGQKPY